MIDFAAMIEAIYNEGADAWCFIYCAKDAKRPRKTRRRKNRKPA